MFHMHIHYQNITHWLHVHPHWGWLAAFIIAFAESIAVIGSIVPGSVTMTAIGILAGSGVLPIWSVIISAIFGAIIGDGISYLGGYFFQDSVKHLWPFSKYPQILLKGQLFFVKHGGKSVFFGRFVGPVRAIVPIVAGTLKFPPKRYFTASILSAIGWAPTYMLPGILLGAVSLEMPAHIAAELIVIVLIILLAVWLVAWLIKQIYRRTRKFFNRILDAKWDQWALQPSKRWICGALRNGEHPQTHGQLLIFFVTLTLGILFLIVLANVIFHGPLTHWNNLIYHWFRGIRTPTINKITVFITSLGNKVVLLPLTITLALWLFIRKRWVAALYWLLIGFLSAGAAFFFKLIYHSHRPLGILANPSTSSFPSGHTALAVAFYGFIAFLLAYKRPKGTRKIIYWITFILCIAIAISRLYLGAHWLTDILGSILLSSTILYFVIILYRRHNLKPIPVIGVIAVTLLTLIASDGYYLYHHFNKDIINSQPYWKTEQLSESVWWQQQSKIIPYSRTNRLGHPIEILNIQWSGNFNHIKAALIHHGWKDILTTNYLDTLKKIAQEKRTVPHALFSKLYRDQHPVMELIKYPNEQTPPLILRLWSAKVALTPGKKTLWIGTIYFDTTKKHFLPFLHKHDKLIALPIPKEIHYLLPSLANYFWEIKSILPTLVPKTLGKRYPFTKVIIIRPRMMRTKIIGADISAGLSKCKLII